MRILFFICIIFLCGCSKWFQVQVNGKISNYSSSSKYMFTQIGGIWKDVEFKAVEDGSYTLQFKVVNSNVPKKLFFHKDYKEISSFVIKDISDKIGDEQSKPQTVTFEEELTGKVIYAELYHKKPVTIKIDIP